MPDRVLTQGDVERRIMELDDRLEVETLAYAERVEEAAIAEADWKGAFARSVVRLAATAQPRTPEGSEATRKAKAEDENIGALRLYLIAEGRRSASRETLLSLRSQIDAVRTLAANIRSQT